jgi:hypothetical protein
LKEFVVRIQCVSLDSFRSRWLVLGLLLASGCGGASEDPETAALRSKYLSASEPESAISLTEAAKLVNVGGDAEAEDAEAEDGEAKDTEAVDPKPDETAADNVPSDDTKAESAKPDDATPDDATPDDATPDNTKPANTPGETSRPKVTLVGRVHAGDLDPWEPGKASFMISELPPDGHGEGHDSDNCPFCKRRLAKAPTGVVKFITDDGQTISVDSRALFGLEKGQTVVVTGTLLAGEFNSIILLADKLHVRAP